MDASTLPEADARYFDRVMEDCLDLLGPGVECDGIDVEQDSDVVLRLRYRLGPVAWSSEGRGSTVTEAHADLRERRSSTGSGWRPLPCSEWRGRAGRFDLG